ncbi:uncharacterized protein proca1 [Scyliorhinus torazame]|uniref:uncharacterized protein proca1 n=1 Tax=Scyliorhinus torazame TaxID=75743 RepID=UPI003B59891D
MWSLIFVLGSFFAKSLASCDPGLREGPGSDGIYYVRSGRFCAKRSALGSAAKPAALRQISDGAELVQSALDGDGQVLECSVSRQRLAVLSFLQECRLRAGGQPGTLSDWCWHREKARCQSFLLQRAGTSTPAPPQQLAARLPSGETVLRRTKRGFTYPGTLWCGAGNNADSYDHLGEFSETDKCCREHDHCEHVIYPFAYSYGHRNFRLHTLSHCDCDTELKQCLRRVNDASSRIVGQAFFNVLEVPCFDLVVEEQCVERYWYGWCKKYDRVRVAVPRESGLYDYGRNVTHELTLEPKPDSDGPTALSWTTSTPSFTAAPEAPKPDATSQQSTLGQVFNAAEDVLKVMATVTQSSAHGNVPGTAGSTAKGKTGMSSDKAKRKKKKGRKNKKRRKGKGKKKNHKAKLSSKAIKATNTLRTLEKKINNKEDYFTDIEKIGNNNEFSQHFFDNSLDLVIKEDTFNDVMNDESYRVDTFTQVHQILTQAVTKPSLRFQHFKADGFTPPAFTHVPNSELDREEPTAKSLRKLVNAHQSPREEAFTPPPTKHSPNSHFNKKETSVLTMAASGSHREEMSTPSIIHKKLNEVAINAKLKANQPDPAPPSERKSEKQRRKRKGRRRKHRKSQQGSKLILPTAPSRVA